MGVPPNEAAEIQNFLTIHVRQMIFSDLIDTYKLKIKYNKIWEYQNKGVPLKRGHQNSKIFNHPR